MNKSSIVISGVNGFVGEHLARVAKEHGFSVHGLGREPDPNHKVTDLVDTYDQCDLMDNDSLRYISLKGVRSIIHLAGLAAVGESFNNPIPYMANNGIMAHNLLSIALEQDFKGRIVIISTGALYDSTQQMPLTEESKLSQSSPYAVGKILEENVGLYYRNRGLDIVIARPFNHIGPGQGLGFLLPDLYQQIINATENDQSSITTGNLTSRRDYTDVRDIVKAYLMLATSDSLKDTVYNVASGTSHSGQEILDTLLHTMRIEGIDAIVDQTKIRPTDAPEIIGDASRIKGELSWTPTIGLGSTINDFIEHTKQLPLAQEKG